MLNGSGSVRFQFHKGTIRTQLLLLLMRKLLHFNSIKVRLEPIDEGCVHTICGDFNSIKVRLEHTTVSSSIEQLSFQFHKGTIRTGQHGCRKCRQGYFNSIKVRLEPYEDTHNGLNPLISIP